MFLLCYIGDYVDMIFVDFKPTVSGTFGNGGGVYICVCWVCVFNFIAITLLY